MVKAPLPGTPNTEFVTQRTAPQGTSRVNLANGLTSNKTTRQHMTQWQQSLPTLAMPQRTHDWQHYHLLCSRFSSHPSHHQQSWAPASVSVNDHDMNLQLHFTNRMLPPRIPIACRWKHFISLCNKTCAVTFMAKGLCFVTGWTKEHLDLLSHLRLHQFHHQRLVPLS